MTRILLIDLSERELQARNRLQSRADQLTALKTSRESGGLTAAQEADLAAIKVALDSDIPLDGFYQAVATQIAESKSWSDVVNGDSANMSYVSKFGLLGSQRHANAASELAAHEREIAAVCGLLEIDNLVNPQQDGFVKRVSQARGEYRQNLALFTKAFDTFRHRFKVTLMSQIAKGLVSPQVVGCVTPGEGRWATNTGTVPPSGGTGGGTGGVASAAAPISIPKPKLIHVFDANLFDRPLALGDKAALLAAQSPTDWEPGINDPVYVLSGRSMAAVVRRLAEDGVSANDPWIASRLESAFNMQAGVVEGAPPSAIEIMLPDLEEEVDIEIQKENLHAVQAIYFAYMLEEMRMFQVVERIVDIFRQGLLPLGRGKVGDYLFNYYKKAAERITEGERRDLYMRVFGAPGGNPGSEPNRDFSELWLRFISAVSSFARQNTVERMLRSTVPIAVSQEQVRKAGRDLGANLSRNGYGIAYFAATELQQSILEFRDVLQDAELRNAFGARDMWQVIDQVNVNYLGGARNTHRYRTQSRAGAVIIRWIAKNVGRLSNMGGQVLYVDQLNNAALRAASSGNNPTVDPTDWDLVNACEQWLAVGGVQEQNIEQYSQPIESPVMTSRPMDMPQAARDVLSGMGVSLPGM